MRRAATGEVLSSPFLLPCALSTGYHPRMTLETDIFQRRRIDFQRLEGFGFSPCESGYRHAETFMNGMFRAEILVSQKGEVSGRVIDLDAGDEFLPLHAEGHAGAFVSEIRDGYARVLRSIAEHCSTPQPFLHAQANRLAEKLMLHYGDEPDFPFRKFPAYGVFRHAGSRKWYALIMSIPFSRLTSKTKSRTQAEGNIVEILNIKIGQTNPESLLEEEGIYPCYHMNRANWVSVLLEDVLPDGRVMELVKESRAATGAAGTPRRQAPCPSDGRAGGHV
ncbi:MAG: MmcQ/YjbR family DNA-binding protein [Desulfovibrio sp.]|nr:MmcQ/YjbR family DNA-binding protein [Desulfovibrio sp.]